MLDKLAAIENLWKDVEMQLSDPGVIADMKKFKQLNKEYKDLKKIVEAYHVYRNVMGNIASAKNVIATEKDPDFVDMAKAELLELEPRQAELEEEIKNLLVPKDPEDARNAVLEIRAGTGGDEAAIFAGDLWRMYQRYCDTHGFKTEVIDVSEGTQGGYKEVVMNIIGDDAYGTLKYEDRKSVV